MTRGAKAAIRATAFGEFTISRAGAKSSPFVTALRCSRPIQNADPSSPRRGPIPPQRTHWPSFVRPRAIEPVPARRRIPGRVPSAPRYAASTSEITRTERARPVSRLARRSRSRRVQIPRDASTNALTPLGLTPHLRQSERRAVESSESGTAGALKDRK